MNMRKMKRSLILAMISVVLVMTSTCVKADTLRDKVEEGYTEKGIYYEVYKTDKQLDDLAASGSVSVTREVLYYAIIIPPMEMEWTETISGVTYSGTLNLQSYTTSSSSQCTLAVYSGKLYAMS